jgi:hypothetical protein
MSKGPSPPSNVGRRGRIEAIDGSHRTFKIGDEIIRKQKVPEKGTRKLIYFQQLQFEDTGATQYRLTYYMLGVKQGARGRWVFGQYSLLVPARHLAALLKEARKRKWPGI